MKARQFIQKLHRAGAVVIEGRGKGGHVLVKFNGKQATVPVHGNSDLGRVFLNVICKQLGLKLKDIM